MAIKGSEVSTLTTVSAKFLSPEMSNWFIITGATEKTIKVIIKTADKHSMYFLQYQYEYNGWASNKQVFDAKLS